MERPSSEQELVKLGGSGSGVGWSSSSNGSNKKSTGGRTLPRPPSYSDSFFFLPTLDTGPYTALGDGEAIVVTKSRGVGQIWMVRGLSFTLHLCLIGIFETLFFFLFISKSEDTGIQGTIQNYVQGVLTSCRGWSVNETAIVSDILSMFMNASQINASAESAGERRAFANKRLEIQGWLYVCGMVGLLVVGGVGARVKQMRVPWRRIIIENIIMVALLGIYEFTFFKTIIYNYQSLTVEELNGSIVHQLQGTCGILL